MSLHNRSGGAAVHGHFHGQLRVLAWRGAPRGPPPVCPGQSAGPGSFRGDPPLPWQLLVFPDLGRHAGRSHRRPLLQAVRKSVPLRLARRSKGEPLLQIKPSWIVPEPPAALCVTQPCIASRRTNSDHRSALLALIASGLILDLR